MRLCLEPGVVIMASVVGVGVMALDEVNITMAARCRGSDLDVIRNHPPGGTALMRRISPWTSS